MTKNTCERANQKVFAKQTVKETFDSEKANTITKKKTNLKKITKVGKNTKQKKKR